MTYEHLMPFGAQCLPDGGTKFRLWALKPERVDLCLDRVLLSMERTTAGWFELTSAEARVGSRYQFVIDKGLHVPDPASRFQPEDVHGPSEIVDPKQFEWTNDIWCGRPWEEAVIYELHVGTFSPTGTFAGVEEKLDYLANLGVTAIELMPVSDFFGKRNWGYDGVLPYAPDSSYGRPEDLKRLIQSAHSRELMVILDVVYNHFGPEGNYLRAYAPQFFTSRHHTPWGEAINFDGEHSRVVRDFFIHNALYWLEEFRFDGLRLDAVHAIQDDSSPDILTEIATTVRNTIGSNRQVHLILENDDNAARYLKPRRNGVVGYNAQWNDDIHHVCHVLASGERDGYYSDYTAHPLEFLGKCLAEGFLFQGEPSPFRGGKSRGEPSHDLPPTSFVSFLQNHDQIGNRAYGERIRSYANPEAVRTIMAILLLAPSPPLIFMGEEFAASTPFLFFCDFKEELARAVTEGRRAEFAKFAQFRDEATRSRIPDPNAESTFLQSRLNWNSLSEPIHLESLNFYSTLLALRKKEIIPLLRTNSEAHPKTAFSTINSRGLSVRWELGNRNLRLLANLSDGVVAFNPIDDRPLYATFNTIQTSQMPPWSAAWYVD